LQKNYSMQAFWIQIRIKLDTCTRLPVTPSPIGHLFSISFPFRIPHSEIRILLPVLPSPGTKHKNPPSPTLLYPLFMKNPPFLTLLG
jgi:hypothetical protein